MSTTKIWFRPNDTDYYGKSTIDVQGNSSVSVVTETLQNTDPSAAYYNSFADNAGTGWIKTEDYGGWRNPDTGLITTDPIGNPGAVNSHYLFYSPTSTSPPYYYANISAKNFTVGNLSSTITDPTSGLYVEPGYVALDYFVEFDPLPDYTFPGGGTLSKTTANVNVQGQWVTRRAYPHITTTEVTFTERYFYQGNTTPGIATDTRLEMTDTGPEYSNTAVTSYSITGNATTLTSASTNTLTNTLFYANVGMRAFSTLTGVDAAINVYIAYEYDWAIYYEVNLHSTGSSISSEFTFPDVEFTLLVGGSADLADTFTITDSSQVSISAAATIADDSASLSAVAGYLHSAESDSTVDSALTAPGGVIIDVEPDTVEAESNITAVTNSTPAGSADLGVETEIVLTASTTVLILAQADLEINTSVLADSSITRGDSTQLEAVADIPLAQPGFLITAGVILNTAEAQVVIEQYVTGGTGVILGSSRADLDQDSEVESIAGLAITAEANLSQDLTTAVGLAGRIRSLELDYQIASELQTIAVEVAQTASANLSAALDLAVVPGYLIGIDLTITQEINSDFDPVQAKIFYVDEYYATRVLPETRSFGVRAENRIEQLDPETRINTTLMEQRNLTVEPETRRVPEAILPTTFTGTRLTRIPQ